MDRRESEVRAAQRRIVLGDLIERHAPGDEGGDVGEGDTGALEHRLAAHDGRIADDALAAAPKLPIAAIDARAPSLRQRVRHLVERSAHGDFPVGAAPFRFLYSPSAIRARAFLGCAAPGEHC
jgi:hypothetical protein